MLFFVASTAIIMPLLFLVVLRMPAKYGMSLSAIILAVFAMLVWGVQADVLAASVLQAAHRALSIVWILLGAVILLKLLERSGAMDAIKVGFETVSTDMRVQVVIVAVLFVAILEGLTGFGTPVAIAAPLLIALGLRPLAAVVLGLIGGTIPVVFGAVGTPLLVGLKNVELYKDEGFLHAVAQTITTIDFALATVLPLVVVAMLVKMFGESPHARKTRHVIVMAPWALLIGLTYAVSAFSVAYLFGPELVSVFAGLLTIIVAILTVRLRLLLPRKTTWQTHAVAVKKSKFKKKISITRAWVPYVVVVIALLFTRLVPPIREWLQTTLDISWNAILGFEAIRSGWELLYSPGTVMLVGALAAVMVLKISRRNIARATYDSGKIGFTALLALVPTFVMLQIFTNSGINSNELLAMPEYIAVTLASVFAHAWHVVAPLLGALGTFIAGSATVSTMTMAEIQVSAAQNTGIAAETVLAQQLSGAATGNMISIHNIVAVSAVVGLRSRIGAVLIRVLPVLALYLVISVVSVYMLLALRVIQ